jgi:hypothetical protein
MPRIHDSITDLIRNTPLIEPQTEHLPENRTVT